MGMTCSMHGKMRNKCNILAAEVKGKRPLMLPRHRWKGTKMDLKGTGHELEKVVHTRAQWWAVVNTVMYTGVPEKAGIS